jgi:hypothetical protein
MRGIASNGKITLGRNDVSGRTTLHWLKICMPAASHADRSIQNKLAGNASLAMNQRTENDKEILGRLIELGGFAGAVTGLATLLSRSTAKSCTSRWARTPTMMIHILIPRIGAPVIRAGARAEDWNGSDPGATPVPLAAVRESRTGVCDQHCATVWVGERGDESGALGSQCALSHLGQIPCSIRRPRRNRNCNFPDGDFGTAPSEWRPEAALQDNFRFARDPPKTRRKRHRSF